jgi:hypothetical protein
VSYWDTLDVSESFAGGCRVANTGLKNRTEHVISLSNASGRRPTTDQRGCLVTQVADADSPVRSARHWPQRIPAIPLALGLMLCVLALRPINSASDRGRFWRRQLCPHGLRIMAKRRHVDEQCENRCRFGRPTSKRKSHVSCARWNSGVTSQVIAEHARRLPRLNVLHETLPDMIAEFDGRFDQNAEKS